MGLQHAKLFTVEDCVPQKLQSPHQAWSSIHGHIMCNERCLSAAVLGINWTFMVIHGKGTLMDTPCSTHGSLKTIHDALAQMCCAKNQTWLICTQNKHIKPWTSSRVSFLFYKQNSKGEKSWGCGQLGSQFGHALTTSCP